MQHVVQAPPRSRPPRHPAFSALFWTAAVRTQPPTAHSHARTHAHLKHSKLVHTGVADGVRVTFGEGGLYTHSTPPHPYTYQNRTSLVPSLAFDAQFDTLVVPCRTAVAVLAESLRAAMATATRTPSVYGARCMLRFYAVRDINYIDYINYGISI